MTKPSLARSKGREARSGVSLKPEASARAREKPATASGSTHASEPPATTTSASPDRIMRSPSASACAPVAHAVAGAADGPFSPARIDTCPAAIFTSILGIKKGETRRTPRSRNASAASTMSDSPPMPDPMETPVLSCSLGV
eukprot:scaffold84591_cov28-Tisochrysis_lutea.AAC.1